MPPPRNRERQILIAIGGAGLFGLAWLAWQALRGLGIGLLGLLILFVAVRIELEGDRRVGTQSTPEFYASHFRAESEQHHAERASRRAEVAAFVSSARMFAIAGALLAIAGFGLIFLGHERPGGSILAWLLGAVSAFTVLHGKPW